MIKDNLKNKTIVIVGPTASGKTGLAVRLALELGGEIVSADSRQVYRYMDVGTGKDLPEYFVGIRNQEAGIRNDRGFEMVKVNNRIKYKIPYHLIDVVHPNTPFDLAKWLKKAKKAIIDIQKRGRVPIVCGGTGLYAQALVDGYELSPVKEDKELRAKLETKSLDQLLKELKRLDPTKFESLNESERGNKQRLIRYIEIASNANQVLLRPRLSEVSGEGGGAVWELAPRERNSNSGVASSIRDNFIVLGVTRSREEIKKLINSRLITRLEKEDMVGEVKRLHEEHRVSWQRLISFGLEYKYISLYLQKKIGYDEMVEQINIASRQFAKRQMSWYRRWESQGRKIWWVKDLAEAKKVLES